MRYDELKPGDFCVLNCSLSSSSKAHHLGNSCLDECESSTLLVFLGKKKIQGEPPEFETQYWFYSKELGIGWRYGSDWTTEAGKELKLIVAIDDALG